MTFGNARTLLAQLYGEREATSILNLLLEDKYGITKGMQAIAAFPSDRLSEWEQDIKRLLAHEPVQYVTGWADFYGLRLHVDSRVLIPRPETEELVHLVLQQPQASNYKTAIDIGTGSGCIAVTLAKHLVGLQVTAIDLSADALAVATANAQLNGVALKTQQLDILSPTERYPLPQFDLIVSNPPYIGHNEAADMLPNVMRYEPHMALFPQGADPLVFYRTIAAFAPQHLTANGSVYLELNPAYAEATADLFRPAFGRITIHPDMQGRPRMLEVSRA